MALKARQAFLSPPPSSSSSSFSTLHPPPSAPSAPQTSTHRHHHLIMTHTCTSELVPSIRSSQTRSWRRTVALAVALARRAVELDKKNTDPMGALAAYTESVRLLRSILARLERHGARSEASRLASINEGYCERMRLLCVACAVPPPPYDYLSSEPNGCSSLAPPSALPPPPAYDEPSYGPTRAKRSLQT
ncbi:hypothetical protein DFH94DRAFT_6642 [Russula ochroleuca]|jgi:hypothetical protein|uniref:MIT domain-containing protein n=1 Tax=Russula ochroleuca TaxID=152965 RepID=A0A9P5N5B2_9AGAM|nr:hypothetical protein DFH94DRAFT_6642 [Russula ochroleuca]